MITRENTKQMKGIAILLMLAHHLYTFAGRIPYGFDVSTSIYISQQELTHIIGMFGKICVSLFMFAGGYGLYASCCRKDNHDSIQVKNQLSSKIVKLYCSYWKVFLIFIPLGFLFFSNQEQYCDSASIWQCFSNYNFNTVFQNFIGWSCSLNGEWWFLKAYLFALFEGFIFIEVFKNKRNLYTECGFVVLWMILVARVFPTFRDIALWKNLVNDGWFSNLFVISEYAVVMLVGIIFCKYQVLDVWKQYISHLKKLEKILVALFTMGCVVYIKAFVFPSTYDIIIAPIFILAFLTLVEEISFLKKPFAFLGRYSTNMWLIHSFFCYYFYPFVRIVYCSNNAIVSYLVLLVLSLSTAILVDEFWKLIKRLYIGCRDKLCDSAKLRFPGGTKIQKKS